MPDTPDDLRAYNCIVYTYTARPNVWRFTAPEGRELAVPISGNLRANNGLAEQEARCTG